MANAKNFPALLYDQKAEIARALPRHLDADRLCRIALTAFRRNQKLAACDPISVFAAVIQAAQLGLEPDTLGRAYLIPYGKECQFIPGWKGLVELMHRSGQGSVWTGAVFVGDEFSYSMGDRPGVTHRPGGGFKPEDLTHVYGIGRPQGCDWPIVEVWSVARVSAHRDRYNKVGRSHYSYEHFEMYARKAVLLQILKYMPLSADLAQSLELGHSAESGSQGLTIDAAIDGTWSPADSDSPTASPDRDWPKANSDGTWTDSSGTLWDAQIHGWSAANARPAVTDGGRFRARRTEKTSEMLLSGVELEVAGQQRLIP